MEFRGPTHVTATLAPDENVLWVRWQKTQNEGPRLWDQGRGAGRGQGFCDSFACFLLFFFFFVRGEKLKNPPQTNIEEKERIQFTFRRCRLEGKREWDSNSKRWMSFFFSPLHQGELIHSPKRSNWENDLSGFPDKLRSSRWSGKSFFFFFF